MTEEISLLIAELTEARVVQHGNREYHCGKLWGQDVVIVFSHWGKVAAAMTATSLITEFGVNRLVFTGVAGGVDPDLRVGDIVVATHLVQHDMDASPLFARHEIPLLHQALIASDPVLRQNLVSACYDYIASLTTGQTEQLSALGVVNPQVVEGVIASGDQFFASKAALDQLRSHLPQTACVEMEGAAVAQVCLEYGIPCAVVRTISDSAGETAAVDFVSFVQSVASIYSRGIIRHFLALQPIQQSAAVQDSFSSINC